MASQCLVASFADPDSLLAAVTAIRARGIKVYDVYAPFPVHGLDQAMGLRPSRLGFVPLAAGTLGLLAALAFQFYANVFDWSMNVGGKPDNSTLAFLPITFEITILAAGLATALAFFLRAGLFPGASAALAAPGVTDDRFAIVLRWKSTGFEATEAHLILRERGAIDVRHVAIGAER
jgi:hypothetical protein